MKFKAVFQTDVQTIQRQCFSNSLNELRRWAQAVLSKHDRTGTVSIYKVEEQMIESLKFDGADKHITKL